MFAGQITTVRSQELYVNTEPASNVPARSLAVRLTGHFVAGDNIYGRFTQRWMPQAMLGLNKNLMLKVSGTIGNMHTNNFRAESYGLYIKYRFLSKDEIHRHFRMAVYAEASKTKAPFHYDEISLMGDKSGVGAGLVATQLWHKLALSGSLAHMQVLDKSRNSPVVYIPVRNYQSLSYTLSAGYLLFPKDYTNYKQVNVNLYTEILGEKILDRAKHYLDIAPAVQFIFNSNTKLNIGARFQVAGNMSRMADNSFLVTYERTFLNLLKKN